MNAWHSHVRSCNHQEKRNGSGVAGHVEVEGVQAGAGEDEVASARVRPGQDRMRGLTNLGTAVIVAARASLEVQGMMTIPRTETMARKVRINRVVTGVGKGVIGEGSGQELHGFSTVSRRTWKIRCFRREQRRYYFIITRRRVQI